MSQSIQAHSYGPGCHLAQHVTFTGSKGDEDMPTLKSQFFYASRIGIDDPLSAIPVPTSKSKSTDHPPRPFSAYDSCALEYGWMSFSANVKGGKRQKKNKSKSSSPFENLERSAITKPINAYSVDGDAAAQLATPIPSDGAPESPSTLSSGCCSITKEAADISSSHNKNPPERNAIEEPACCLPKELPETPGPPKNGVMSFFKRAISTDNIKANPDGQVADNGVNQTSPQNLPPVGKSSSGDGFCDDEDHSGRDNSLSQKSKKKELNGKEISQDMVTSAHGLDNDQVRLPNSSQQNRSRGRSIRSDLPEAQGDGFNNVQPPAEGGHDMESCEDPHEHMKVEKHTNCKSHQAFVSHYERRHDIPEPDSDGKENKPEKRSRSWSPKRRRSPTQPNVANQSSIQPNNLPAPNAEATITGRPFLRLPSRRSKPEPSPQSDASPVSEDQGEEQDGPEQETVHVPGCKAQKNTKEKIDIPVGISRLHHVQLPSLQMMPIYWSPVHDVAAVTRGTWFYKDTMYPVEPPVANQLEMGYRELRPWSETWSDELNSAIDVGAEAEEKIAHQLWPKESDQKPSSRKKSEHMLSTNPYCAAKCFNGEAAAEGITDWEDIDSKQQDNLNTITKKYPSSQVIYKDSQNAFILKPTLQPSAYYGRKPLNKIKKGQTVGIHVVRGFDWKAWEKLHPSKKSQSATKAEDIAPVAVDTGNMKPNECQACKHEEERPKVTDVVFVIHGIGQKLSERMESFHFTHAINGFRRSVNLEMSHRGVQKVLREDLGGIMVLPINWRTNLSFEDGGPMKEEDKNRSASDHFTLDDITPTTIPAVRNMISDVMLDIPFYMSHHKPKMIEAVIAEANRVYRLWCQNNPEFAKEGRVHIIAHSLGSAMAIDVLSKQPTSVPKFNPYVKKINTKYFDFNTTNLFLAGSPAGFFLYLDKAMLLPRRGQHKPDAEKGDDQDKTLVGDAGTYGCLAIDNIYNIMHYNDPIAYRMNAAVDPQYASSLKNAQVPSATIGFFETIGNAMRVRKASTDVAPVKAPGIVRLPSQLEMDVHDFTREEIAERKFCLLNDNGQIDWFLSSGGGPLEIQYINMLGAHSSYWDSQDFIRFIVIEVGRTPGKSHALSHMKAVKVGAFKAVPKS